MDLFVALIAVAIGLVACFFGYRLFRAVLPVFGFVLGAIVGAQAVFLIFNEGIFATLLSIVAAVVVGIVFGLLAYFWWALGIVLAVGGMGFAIGNALLPALNLEISRSSAGCSAWPSAWASRSPPSSSACLGRS